LFILLAVFFSSAGVSWPVRNFDVPDVPEKASPREGTAAEPARQLSDPDSPVTLSPDGAVCAIPPESSVSRSRDSFPRALFSGGDDVFFSMRSMEVLLVGADLTLLARSFDHRIVPKLEKESEAVRVGNFLGSTTGDLLSLGTVWGLGLISGNEKLRYHAYGLTKAAAYTAVLTRALKAATDRDRPNSESEGSFPSGHTSGAFTAASYFDTAYGHRLGIPLYGLAAFIGYSRLAEGKHYFSDVVAGATLGVIVGRAMAKHHKNKWEKKSNARARR
jgi:hypothetical protein